MKRFLVCLSAAMLSLAPMKSTPALTPREFFERLNKDTMELVEEFYAEDAVFQDPVVSLKGPAAIRAHYAYQYEGVTSIRWDFEPEIVQGDRRVLVWTMHLAHPRLNGGREYGVPGNSVFRMANGKVVYQRDYFDMGDFVYERIPAIGSLIRVIKGRMTTH